MKKIKVIHIFSHLDAGGAETLILNIHRKIEVEKIDFYYLVQPNKQGVYDEEIQRLGGKLVYIKPFKNNKNYIRDLIKIFEEIKPDVVHSHVYTFSGIVLSVARKCGVKIRIAHSHTTKNVKGHNWLKKLYSTCMKFLIHRSANVKLACSIEAGESLFNKNSDFKVINNAIDFDNFKNAYSIKNELIKEFNFKNDTKLIGHIGSFREVKNHSRLIEIFNDLSKLEVEFSLILIGKGELESEIKKKVKDLKLENKVAFLGNRFDIANLLKSMDVFVFPSKFEGLGLALIEAQSAGTRCVVSNNIPSEVDLNIGLVDFLDLEASNSAWINAIKLSIIKNNPNESLIQSAIMDRQYDISFTVDKIREIYLGENL